MLWFLFTLSDLEWMLQTSVQKHILQVPVMTRSSRCAVLGCVWRPGSNATKGHRHLTAFLRSEVWKISLSCLAPMFLPKTFPTARHRELPNLEGDKQILQKAWVLWWLGLQCQMLRCSSQVQNVQTWVISIPRNPEKWVWEDSVLICLTYPSHSSHKVIVMLADQDW